MPFRSSPLSAGRGLGLVICAGLCLQTASVLAGPAPAPSPLVNVILGANSYAEKTAARDALIAQGPGALDQLGPILADSLQATRLTGVFILQEVGGTRACTRLLELLGDPDPLVRHQSHLALVKITGRVTDFHFDDTPARQAAGRRDWAKLLRELNLLEAEAESGPELTEAVAPAPEAPTEPELETPAKTEARTWRQKSPGGFWQLVKQEFASRPSKPEKTASADLSLCTGPECAVPAVPEAATAAATPTMEKSVNSAESSSWLRPWSKLPNPFHHENATAPESNSSSLKQIATAPARWVGKIKLSGGKLRETEEKR